MNIYSKTPNEFQLNLIKAYLKSNMFTKHKESIADGKKALISATNIKHIDLNNDGFICTYGGLFGLGSKIKNVICFSIDKFYHYNTSESKASIIQYKEIKKVLYAEGSKTGTLICNNGQQYIFPKKLFNALEALFLIIMQIVQQYVLYLFPDLQIYI